MTRPHRIGIGLLALTVLLGLASTHMAVVPDDAMSPSLLPGDLLLILPVAPREGDVVALRDPLDPGRYTLRRIEAIGGALRYDGRTFRTGSRSKIRLLDMGEYEGRPVLLEGEHVTLRAVTPTRQSFPEIGVPDDRAFLSADNRDSALDSRWWGPVPLDAIGGVVVARIGAPTTPWRGIFGTRGEAAVVPKASKLKPV